MVQIVYRFLIFNIEAIVYLGMLLAIKYALQSILTQKAQYNLLVIFFVILLVIWIPFNIDIPSYLASVLTSVNSTNAQMDVAAYTINRFTDAAINDFTISIMRYNYVYWILLIIWFSGMIVMIIRLVNSYLKLVDIRKKAILVIDENIALVYQKCKVRLKIIEDVPLYIVSNINSAFITGVLCPTIYIPIDYNNLSDKEIEYILIHELQHFKNKDTIKNLFLNIISVIYWFNPVIRYAVNRFQLEKELACDEAILSCLDSKQYIEYGKVLINRGTNSMVKSSPFVSYISKNKKELKYRIIHISKFRPISKKRKARSKLILAGILILTIFLIPKPILSKATYIYKWDISNKNITAIDAKFDFEGYEGCFVLYDLNNDSYKIYNQEHAMKRLAPNSTYKIYDALFALEEKIITPNNSVIKCENKNQPIEAWNNDQNLETAIRDSVNWYFNSLDNKQGKRTIKKYINKINYGNKDISGNINTYWLESSLKISAIEQVELFSQFLTNKLKFEQNNIDAVKNSMIITSSEYAMIYGKTGTGRINNKDISGWFVGAVEYNNEKYVFATNIVSNEIKDKGANGIRASEITFKLLRKMLD